MIFITITGSIQAISATAIKILNKLIDLNFHTVFWIIPCFDALAANKYLFAAQSLWTVADAIYECTVADAYS